MNLQQSRSVLDSMQALLTRSHLNPNLVEVTAWESNPHFASVRFTYPVFGLVWEIAFGLHQGQMVPSICSYRRRDQEEWDTEHMVLTDILPGLPTFEVEEHQGRTMVGIGA